MRKAYYHLPGLFEFYELYRLFLPLFREHREYFYDWCEIGSIYGAPADCIWGGGRTSFGEAEPREVLALMREYGISARLTFSNSLLREEHLADKKCNALCALAEKGGVLQNGVIVSSDLLLAYLEKRFPGLYCFFPTKVLTDFRQLQKELDREAFRYVVPDFRLNKKAGTVRSMNKQQKEKVEFLCNECCWFAIRTEKPAYEAVSRKNLGEGGTEHVCTARMQERDTVFQSDGKSGLYRHRRDPDAYLPVDFSILQDRRPGAWQCLIPEFLL